MLEAYSENFAGELADCLADVDLETFTLDLPPVLAVYRDRVRNNDEKENKT